MLSLQFRACKCRGRDDQKAAKTRIQFNAYADVTTNKGKSVCSKKKKDNERRETNLEMDIGKILSVIMRSVLRHSKNRIQLEICCACCSPPLCRCLCLPSTESKCRLKWVALWETLSSSSSSTCSPKLWTSAKGTPSRSTAKAAASAKHVE